MLPTDPQSQALFAMAMGLLGPGQNLGAKASRAGLLGLNQLQQAQAMQARLEEEKQQREMRAAQMAQMKQAQEAQAYMGAGIGKFMSPGSQGVPYNDALGDGQQGFVQPPQAPSFDKQGFAQYLAQNPATAREALNFLPQPKLEKVGNYLVDTSNPNAPKTAWSAPEKPHWLDGGDKWIPVDVNGKQSGSPVPKNISPEAAARLGIDRAQLGVSLARARDEGIGGLPGLPGSGFVVPAIPDRPAKARTGPASQPPAPATAPAPVMAPNGGLSPKQHRELAAKNAEEAAKAKRDLPKVVGEASNTYSLLADLIQHPGMREMVGMPNVFSGAAPRYLNAVPFVKDVGPVWGTDSADFKARLDQLDGRSFLQAYQSLKGGGQITEIEGAKATSAINRMKTAQSEAEFIGAAQELQGMLNSAMNQAKEKAGVSARGGWSMRRLN